MEEAVQGLSTLSMETRRWLRSAKREEIATKPFSRMQEKASQLRAARLWARLLCYCVRVVAAEAEEEENEEDKAEEEKAPGQQRPQRLPLGSIVQLFPWHGRQKLAAERLWLLLEEEEEEDGSAAVAKQRVYVVRLSQALIFQDVYNQPFSSALIHYLAALSVDPTASRLCTAAQFSSKLGSLLYCVRALAIEVLLPACDRAEQGAAKIERFCKQRAAYLVDGSYSPMSTMLSLLAYAKHISLRTPGSVAGSMWWSADRQTYFLKGRPIQMQQFCQLAQGVVAEAEQLLWQELLWTNDQNERRSIDLAAIEDDASLSYRGVCFLRPSHL